MHTGNFALHNDNAALDVNETWRYRCTVSRVQAVLDSIATVIVRDLAGNLMETAVAPTILPMAMENEFLYNFLPVVVK